MARFITRPGPPPRKNDEKDDFPEKNEDVEMDPDPSGIPEIPEQVEFDETPENEQEDEEAVEAVCMDWWIYAKPIEVYLCLQPPEKLAWDIFLWERLENIGIDQCIDVHPASPCQPETNIPPGGSRDSTLNIKCLNEFDIDKFLVIPRSEIARNLSTSIPR